MKITLAILYFAYFVLMLWYTLSPASFMHIEYVDALYTGGLIGILVGLCLLNLAVIVSKIIGRYE